MRWLGLLVLRPLNELVRFEARNCWNMASSCQRLNESSAKELIDSVDNCLFDCDGVLWDGRGAIDGSLDTIKKLKAMNKNVFYITNNSSKTRAQYLKKAQGYGYPAKLDDIVCTAYMAALYLKNREFKGKVFLVGNSAMAEELETCGIEYTGLGTEPTKGTPEDWLDIKLDPEVRCVLAGFDPDICYMKILRAASHLKEPSCLFLGTNEDPYLPVADSHVRIPGTGTMVKAVAFPAQRQPLVIGKPEPPMFEELRKLHNLDPARCMMVGDRIESDMGLAKACGLRSLLVLTGVTREEELPHLSTTVAGLDLRGTSTNAPILPDFFVQGLKQLGEFLS